MAMILRALSRGRGSVLGKGILKQWGILGESVAAPIFTAYASYSRRSDSKNLDVVYKVVKSKVHVQDQSGSLGVECGPNWELLAPRGNRFYFPCSVGPAWQGASTTIHLEVPLERLIDFDDDGTAKDGCMLKLSVGQCPYLIKKSLHELFPTPEVISSSKMTLLTLKSYGDNECGARQFVLAARELSARLRLHGFWADFMNPFSGKPFYSWASGKNLYTVDERFRGLNMKLIMKNNCMVISTDDEMRTFSGAIYTTAPSNILQLRTLIHKQV